LKQRVNSVQHSEAGSNAVRGVLTVKAFHSPSFATLRWVQTPLFPHFSGRISARLSARFSTRFSNPFSDPPPPSQAFYTLSDVSVSVLQCQSRVHVRVFVLLSVSVRCRHSARSLSPDFLPLSPAFSRSLVLPLSAAAGETIWQLEHARSSTFTFWTALISRHFRYVYAM